MESFSVYFNRNFWGYLLRYLQMWLSAMRNATEASPNTNIEGTIRKRELFTVRTRFDTRARVLQPMCLLRERSCNSSAWNDISPRRPNRSLSIQFFSALFGYLGLLHGWWVCIIGHHSQVSRFNNGSTDTAPRSASAHWKLRLSDSRNPICMWQNKFTFLRLC